MASYTIRSAASSGIYAKLVLTEQSQSVANNTTTLSWQLYMWNTQAKPNWYAYEEHNIVQISINGQYVLNTDDFGMISLQYEQTESSAKLIASDTITIAHGSNGSKAIAASFYVEQGWYGAYKWSGSNSNIALTAIARASKPSLSVSSLTFGGSVTIYTNRASDGFMHTLTYSIGSASGTIGTDKGIGASYSWTPSKDLAKQFPNESKGRVTITCTTYNGSTPIGDPVSIELELVVSSDMVPTITSVTLTEVGQSVLSHSSVGGYIQSKSKLQYTVNVDTSTAYGATVSSYQVKINGGTYNKSSDTTGYLNTTGTNTVVATIIDSRGNPVTYDKTTFNVVSYSPPRIDYINAFRANSSGVSDEDGSYLMVELTNTITSLGGANGRSVTIETRQSNSSTWTPRNVFVSDGYVGFNCWTYGGDVWADPSLSYEVRVQVSDSFGSSTYYTSISTASTCINIRPNKDGIAFGKMAEKAKTVQLGWDLELKGDPTADNHAVTKGYVDNTKQTLCKATIDLREYDESIWYPVDTFIENLGLLKIHVHSRLHDGDIPSWCQHSSGFYADFVMLVEHSGWGESNCRGICLHHDYKFADTNPIGYTQLSNNSRAVLYLRGGGIYYVDTDWNCEWAIRTSDLTVSNQTASLKTSYPGVTGYVNANIYANLVGNVTGDLDGTAAKANRIRPTSGETYGTGNRLSSANIAPRNDSSLYTFLATSSMTEGKPNGDGNILHMEWDNGGWSTQLFIPHSSNKPMQYRHMADNTWMSYWISLLDSDSVADYPVAQATSGHGIWSFIKFNSGIAMCWGRTAVYNTTFPSTWGSWRVNDYLFPAQRFPFDFVAIPQVFASQGNPGTTACDWAIYSDGGATTQYTPKYSVFRPAAVSATVNLSLNLFAIGRWK